jgi:hypothetical protein
MTKLTLEQVKDLTEVLSTVWNGDGKMIEHCLKSSKYVYINNRFIDCCQSKPTIHTTLWYDDETDGPGKSYESFVYYNMKNAPDLLPKNYKYYIMEHYTGRTTGRLMGIASLKQWDTVPEGYTLMTDQEVKAVNAAITEVREDYAKRLENYFKKYSSYICSSGYWVNR